MNKYEIHQTRWAHACVLAIERALGRPFSGEDAARVQRALLNDTAAPPSTDDARDAARFRALLHEPLQRWTTDGWCSIQPGDLERMADATIAAMRAQGEGK